MRQKVETFYTVTVFGVAPRIFGDYPHRPTEYFYALDNLHDRSVVLAVVFSVLCSCGSLLIDEAIIHIG